MEIQSPLPRTDGVGKSETAELVCVPAGNDMF